MNRWIAIRASSALAIAGGLASLAASAALAAGLLLLTPRYPGPLPPRLLFVGGVLSCIVFGALAVWSLWTGVAVLGRRPWARQSMITLGGTIAMFGATGTLSSAFTPLGTVTSADEQLARMVRISLALLFGVMAATGVCWIALFNSAFAKRYFSSEARSDGI